MLHGGCQCGHVRYAIHQPPLRLTVCHCLDCQKQSASAFGMSLAIDPASFELLQGTLRRFEVVCDSGRIKTCTFCPECGVRIYHETDNGRSVKAGTLDERSGLVPSAHYWTARKQPWVEIPEDVASYPDDG